VNDAFYRAKLCSGQGQSSKILYLAFIEGQNDKTLTSKGNCASDKYLFFSTAYFDFLKYLAA